VAPASDVILLGAIAAAIARPLPPAPGARVEQSLRANGDSEVVAVIEGTPRRRELFSPGAPWTVEAEGDATIQVRVAVADLDRLAAIPGVTAVRAPRLGRAKAIVSEGYDEVMDIDWHGDGIDGAGVRIGIVDVGFHGHEDLLGVELPDTVRSNFDLGVADGSGHGTCVAEVIHDFAPAAELYLATFSTDVEFEEAVDWLVDQDVHMINGSVGFDNTWHADGTSAVTQRADAVVEAGIAWVGAAGNENDKYRVGALSMQGDRVAIDGMAELYCGGGASPRVSFRWSEPFGAAAVDLDLVLLGADGVECGSSTEPQDGDGDPYETVTGFSCREPAVATIVPADPAAEVEGLTGWLYCYDGLDAAQWSGRDNLTLPGDTVLGVSVGALDPATGMVPYYGSRGPTDDGRLKPDVIGPSDVSTATWGTSAYGRGNFRGSSAAAPHVSGLAALWMQASLGHGHPEVFGRWLAEGAEDAGVAGPDMIYGDGLARAGELPALACGCAAAGARTAGGGGGWIVAGGALAAAGARRRSTERR
jgi:hypothetical protein